MNLLTMVLAGVGVLAVGALVWALSWYLLVRYSNKRWKKKRDAEAKLHAERVNLFYLTGYRYNEEKNYWQRPKTLDVMHYPSLDGFRIKKPIPDYLKDLEKRVEKLEKQFNPYNSDELK